MLEEFPYYPTDLQWRRKEFSRFLHYEDHLWDGKKIKKEKALEKLERLL